MTIGIYCIRHIDSDKRYVGKSVNIECRFKHHVYSLNKTERDKKSTNRHLFNAVKCHGIENFAFEILHTFDTVDNDLIAQTELFYMMYYATTDRNYGYNMRLDSSTKMIVHPDTLALYRNRLGEANSNYGNKWSIEKKEYMSQLKIKQHTDGVYTDEWRRKIGEASALFWKDNPDKKDQMASKVKLKKEKYKFIQKDNDDRVIRVWESMDEILGENPTWKWQNIYSVCNGYKKRIYGYKWESVLK